MFVFLVCHQLFNVFYSLVKVTSCFWWFYPFCMVQIYWILHYRLVYARTRVSPYFLVSAFDFLTVCFLVNQFFLLCFGARILSFSRNSFDTNFFVFAWPYFFTHIILFITSNMSKKLLKSRKTKRANVLLIWNDNMRRITSTSLFNLAFSMLLVVILSL